MRIVREDLVRDGIDQVPLPICESRRCGVATTVGGCIPRKVKLDQILRAEAFAVDRVLVRVLVKPGANDLDVEDGALGRADGVVEGLEGGGTEVEG